VGIEAKSAARWRTDDGRALKELRAAGAIQRAFAIYLGDRPLKDGAISVLPAMTFFRELTAGRVLRPARRSR
jgi:hypothetical protein